MDSYQETFETWNKVAGLYEDRFMQMDIYDETYDFICSNIPRRDAAILEIGCGPGNITRYLLAKRPDFKIHGIDIAPNMVALARKNNPTASFSVMDSRKIDELETKFDGIVCGFCLPYLSEQDNKKLIADAASLLTGGGIIYISFVEGSPSESGFKTASSGDRAFFYYHDLGILESLLAKNGFEVLKICKVQYERSATEKETHTVLTARKKTT